MQRSADSILEGLDPEQRRVATEISGPMCVLAGAGTGKTRAITHRIAYGIAIGRYNPRSVLALTFTTRAAEEMKVRLRALGAVGVVARTFHSAALAQLKYFWPQAIGGSTPEILKNKAQFIIESARRLGLGTDRAIVRDLAAEIEWAKVSMLTPDTLMPNLAHRELRADITPIDMVRLFRTYEELKDERNVIDFEDILLLTIAIIEENPQIAAQIHQQYRHFVVDEYQDVSPLQQRLLDAWLGQRDDICVVGDASQTIYSFAGATSRHLLDFPRRFEGATVVKLIRAYRSTPQVVQLANRLLAARRVQPDSTRFSWAPPLELKSQRPGGPEAAWFGYADDEQEAAGIAEDIRDYIEKDGVPAAEIAVLYRTNGQSAALEQALNDAGIKYQLRGAEKFFDRAEVRAALSMLQGAAKGADSAESVPELVRDNLKSLGWSEKAPERSGQVRQRWESLETLVALADRLTHEREQQRQQAATNDAAELPPELTIYEFVAVLFQRSTQRDAPSMNGVTLASLHSAKGLEWDAVFLCGLNEGLMPISFAKTSDAVDEERRLFYVGITRARKYLTFTWSRSRTPGGRSGRQRSRFINDIAPKVV
ncbi:ATP-dependent helicase [Rothia sp. P100]|uniref:ATP-dependent helicase n=1 Tax=Rothia sp. P100 TaxID=2939578 RepID=UPI00203A7ECD|nr:ATP-dependent helicase [Rothia sp. P100]MCM3509485.1 ATP-dependent helicase [Rothia sp. P100]